MEIKIDRITVKYRGGAALPSAAAPGLAAAILETLAAHPEIAKMGSARIDRLDVGRISADAIRTPAQLQSAVAQSVAGAVVQSVAGAVVAHAGRKSGS